MTVLDLPVARITAQARQVRFGHVALAVVAWLLVSIGRLAYAVMSGLWLVLAWCGTAVKVGWQEARAEAERRRGADTKRT